MIDLFLLLITLISYLQKSISKFRNKYDCNIHNYICREKNSKEHKHKNQSHVHTYFWTIVPGKTQCGKTGATYEGFIIILHQMNLYKEYTGRYNQKTPKTKFSAPPDNFLTPIRASAFLCVCLHVSLCSPCIGLHHST